MTFDELFAEHKLTPAERESLIAFLASLRMQATLRALSKPPAGAPPPSQGQQQGEA